MSATDFKEAVSRCDFLFDWQKDRLVGLLDGVNDERDGNGHVRAVDVFPVVDNVLRRTVGVSLDLLPVADRMNIEWAVREATR